MSSFSRPKGGSAPRRKPNPLTSKFQFNEAELSTVMAALDNSQSHVEELARMNLHIKGMGFLRKDIVGVVGLLGMDSTDLANWEGIASLRGNLGGDNLKALYAYKAGLTPSQTATMDDSLLTTEKLHTMARLKTV